MSPPPLNTASPPTVPGHNRADRDQCPAEDELVAALIQGNAARGSVLAHIEKCDMCRVLAGEAARSLESKPNILAPSTLHPGQQVGDRFVIESFVARGGMGEVYRARDTILNETVALKTLLCARIDSDSAINRFKIEVQLARKVTHANVCRILDFGVHRHVPDHGPVELLPFLTMDLLQGKTLGRTLAESGPFPLSVAMKFLRDILAGLEAIHAAGIVHRDLKSENIFLVETPGSENARRAVLMDFGLARTVSMSGSASLSGSIVGTPGYMAPEQVEGRPTSPMTDIYSLGIIIHEMLTGRLPSGNDLPSGESMPTPPGASTRDTTDRIIPERLKKIIKRCLQFAPAARFPGVQALREALEAVPNEPASTFSLPHVTRGMPRLITAASALVLLGLLGWAYTVQHNRAAGVPNAKTGPETRSATPAVTPPPVLPTPVLATPPVAAPPPTALPAPEPPAPVTPPPRKTVPPRKPTGQGKNGIKGPAPSEKPHPISPDDVVDPYAK